MRRTVCVTGGSGGIGQSLLDRLANLYDVKVLFRQRTPTTDLWQKRGCTPVWGDIGNDNALSELVEGADIVFHCAALVGNAPYEDAYAVNVAGTRALAVAAARTGCRFVHLSSIAVYTAAAPRPAFTEDTPVLPTDDLPVYARTKIESEQALREVALQSGLAFTILRPTCVYGPRTIPFTQVPIKLIRAGLPVILGDGKALMDVVFADDVARAMVQAAESQRAANQIFNIGHQTLTMEEFYSGFGEMVGGPVRHLPIGVLRGLSRVVDLFSKAIPGRTDNAEKALRYLTTVATNAAVYPSARAAESFGYAPSVTLPVGMLKTAVWARSEGLISRRTYNLPVCGPLPFQPSALAHPERESDIVQCIAVAREGGLRARAIGSLHSQCAVADTEGVCIVLDRYKQILAVNGNLVTVEAGITLTELNEELARHNLALPILGSITAQTVSGAISTATHGGALRHGALSDYVERLRLVRADGTIFELARSSPNFDASVVSFGLLGVISSVTLRCVPAFTLRSSSLVADAADVFARFDEYQRSAEFVDMMYFPVADKVEVLTIERTGEGLVPQTPTVRHTQPGALGRAAHYLQLKVVRGVASVLLCSITLQRIAAKAVVGGVYRTTAGPSHTVLAFNGNGPAIRSPMIIGDMEVAIPYDQASTALSVLRDHFQRTRRFPLIPVHIRASARSAQWLSPAYEREVCWIELCSYPRNSSLFEEVQALLAPFNFRFHWGKFAPVSADYISGQYDRWDEWGRLRAAWDPDGIFMNAHLAPFFGRNGVSAAIAGRDA
ncbi:MAG TPA: NAD-dependent epimerase/dehydratase family protein [Bryobacteraceae bacterium]|nr:NAD-dependent epimerase/dehydratase family protein [Bryobacteraceae bacterium]